VTDQSRVVDGFLADRLGFRCNLEFFIAFLRSDVCLRALAAADKIETHLRGREANEKAEKDSIISKLSKGAATASTMAASSSSSSSYSAHSRNDEDKKKRLSPVVKRPAHPVRTGGSVGGKSESNKKESESARRYKREADTRRDRDFGKRNRREDRQTGRKK
jgi:hypothetical protein